jgi:hypothetical protein
VGYHQAQGAGQVDVFPSLRDPEHFARIVVGWLIAAREDAELTQQLTADLVACHAVQTGTYPSLAPHFHGCWRRKVGDTPRHVDLGGPSSKRSMVAAPLAVAVPGQYGVPGLGKRCRTPWRTARLFRNWNAITRAAIARKRVPRITR